MYFKKEWNTPIVEEYGKIEELTQGKWKDPGSRDDFGVTGISDA
jgi:hypothetical protein